MLYNIVFRTKNVCAYFFHIFGTIWVSYCRTALESLGKQVDIDILKSGYLVVTKFFLSCCPLLLLFVV